MLFNKNITVLLVALFFVIIGSGITLPVLPIYITNLSLAQGISSQNLWVQVGLLTGIYPLSNFRFHHILARYRTGMEEDDLIER